MATSCPACGAPIFHGVTAEGETVPLDMQTDWTGEGRYIIERQVPNGKHEVVRVKPSYDRPAYPDHRLDCPDYDNGRSTR
jgi:hypothetical protein